VRIGRAFGCSQPRPREVVLKAPTTLVEPADPDTLERAAALIRAGRLVAFPTETVYGLGADATSDVAVARIYEAKGRPRFNPLIAHVADVGAARRLAVFDARAEAVAARFWPGPLTLVLPRRADCPVSLLACAGLDTVAIRVPAHPIARALLRAAAVPVAAPSANPSGAVSPTTAAHVVQGLDGRVDMVIDGGACAVGLESTILDLSGADPVLLRPGGVTAEDLCAVIGPVAMPGADAHARPKSPGLLLRHYAPGIPVRLGATAVGPEEALLAFGADVPGGAVETLNLSPSGDLTEAAANLFRYLRALDRPGRSGIAVMPVPERGLGAAINDRLRRAATPP